VSGIVLVTGAAGFIGRRLVEHLLADGERVRALVRASVPSWAGDAEIVRGDIREGAVLMAAADGVETVFHLAGRAHAIDESRGDEQEYVGVNVEGTRHVLAAALARGARAVVFLSSVKAMGEGGPACLDESAPARPVTAYGRSKLAAEELIARAAANGLHAVSLRLPLVYGPGVKGNLHRMIEAIDRRRFPPLADVGNRRSMVHVDDVVAALRLAAGAPVAAGHRYIVTDERAYSTREIYESMCRALGRPVSRLRLPVAPFFLLARAGDLVGRASGRRFPLDSDALDKLIGSAWYSSANIARELGYRPRWTLPEAMPAMVARYRSAVA
jgi:UDP-glucose 4-epimerase